MSKKFNLGDYLKADVSELNTAEQISYLPLDQIDPDPENFYSLEGIDELAGNIELIGLQQPLRVRPEAGRYVVVSGHRRRAACLMIRDGGNEMFANGVPCIVERGEASPEMRELRLIYANANTRVMSSAEVAKQAERVTELLYALKEQGVEFPGRMREHVAQACQVSESKLARLSAIKNNLRDSYRLFFDAGKMTEAAAYRMSQESPETQQILFRKIGAAACNMTADTLDKVIEQAKKSVSKTDTPSEAPVSKTDTLADQLAADVDGYLEERAAEDDKYFELLSRFRFRFAAPLSCLANRQDGISSLKSRFSSVGYCSESGWYDGSAKGLEMGTSLTDKIFRTWTEVYDMLCLMALNDMAIKGEAEEDVEGDEDDEDEAPENVSILNTEEPEPRWIEGDKPARDGRYLCKVDMGLQKLSEQSCDYQNGVWSCYGRPIDEVFSVKKYWPVPEKGD